jgi:hypothetical protein
MHSLNTAGAIRRIVGDENTLFALTTEGIFRSTDTSQNWEAVEDLPFPFAQVVDLALDGDMLYILLAGGQLCRL